VWLRIFWVVALLVLIVTGIVMMILGHLRVRAPGRLTAVYRRHFAAPRRERLFLSSLGFFVTFFAVRGVTHAIRAGVGGLRDVAAGGVHIHHLVWGILLLLVVGYAWLVQVGTGTESGTRAGSRITALLYGIGAALTLDEFALWLRLEDVYWSREGRESIEAVLLFGGLLSLGLWGAPFFRGLVRESVRLLRR
jgi:hypothetical protein